ncbi:MAG: prenyltransferase/squalene oxidase repeat-containing protein [Chloroflexota bacterium]|nr:prenyltransferase/squalene oxidase repeat-containing protein [Chloroflexota bacterium]
MQPSGWAFLAEAQNPDGGWGYAIAQDSSVEATAAVVIATSDDPKMPEARVRALDWLDAAQHRDGGWGISADDQQSGWQTAWGLLAIVTAGSAEDSVARSAQWLLDVDTPEPSADAMQQLQPLLEIDLTLKGWPWLPGQATWIEPTALAMLALAVAGHADSPRVTNAVRYLTDRRCPGGGWNVGNPVMFSQPLPPRAHPTAWALLALSRIAPETIMSQDVAAVREAMADDGGALALAWGLLAQKDLGLDDSAASDRLVAQQQPNGSWNANPYHTAVAFMATGRTVPW